MIIGIDADFSFETETGGMQKSKVPDDAVIVDGPAECPEDLSAAYIELLWVDDEEHEWSLGLSFEATETDYTMVLVNGSYSEDLENGTGPFLNVWEDKNFDFA
ncbi:hypothetical protein, partial [Salmonella sp. s54395]|uniref:hypothetical protein n=1 Tax=Salmonella sp. s54395 TaxID=3159664 RepID=UPI00397EF9C3